MLLHLYFTSRSEFEKQTNALDGLSMDIIGASMAVSHLSVDLDVADDAIAIVHFHHVAGRDGLPLAIITTEDDELSIKVLYHTRQVCELPIKCLTTDHLDDLPLIDFPVVHLDEGTAHKLVRKVVGNTTKLEYEADFESMGAMMTRAAV